MNRKEPEDGGRNKAIHKAPPPTFDAAVHQCSGLSKLPN